MKKLMLYLSIAAMLAMPMTMDASAQSPRHTPRTNATKTTATAATTPATGNDSIAAFSDTTSVADEDNAATSRTTYSYDTDDADDIQELKEVMNAIGPTMIMPVFIISIMFIVAPAVIIGIICYFIYKNRQQKIKLAEMAMKNGQPIPDSVLGYKTRRQQTTSSQQGYSQQGYSQQQARPAGGNNTYNAANPMYRRGFLDTLPTEDPLWRKGVMHFFVGLGLMLLLDNMMGDFGFSIGVIGTLYGAGQAFIAWTSNRNSNQQGAMYEEPQEPAADEAPTSPTEAETDEKA